MRRFLLVLAVSFFFPALNVLATVTVLVRPRTASVTFTQVQQFKATVSGTTNIGVKWSVDGIVGGNATVGFISSTGLYTPPKIWGPHKVTATSVADATASASAPVVVSNYGTVDTFRYDKSRSGTVRSEIVLTASNVNPTQFGKLFSYSVDAFVNAQPLYVANLAIPNQGFHNVVYVATENNSVYAFDANGRSTAPLWFKNFLNPLMNVTTVPCTDVTDCSGPTWGITGTPVIDLANKTMFLVARTKENTAYVQRLHALDITTGAEKLGGPIVISASVSGTGEGSNGTSVSFDPLRENNRPALLLLNGMVYVAFGSSMTGIPIMAGYWGISQITQPTLFHSSLVLIPRRMELRARCEMWEHSQAKSSSPAPAALPSETFSAVQGMVVLPLVQVRTAIAG